MSSLPRRTATGLSITLLLAAATIFVSVRGGWHQRSGPGQSGPLTFSGPTMGTWYHVTIPVPSDNVAAESIKIEIDTRLEAVNDWMSTYRPDSELSRFNRSTGNDWFSVSPQTAFVVAEARRISDLTGGAFDVTVGPLVDLWGFGPRSRKASLPTDAELAAQKARVGYSLVEVRLEPPALRKLHDDVQIDLSAIAKGFAVDYLADYLASLRVTAYMIEVGGEVRTKGHRLDGSAWRIGIEAPVESRREIHSVVLLSGKALATSGDYRNFFESNGKKYSHEIDPKTGRPVTHHLASVSVVDDHCARADALATALMVLGPVEGYNLAEESGIPAYFLIREVAELRELVTPAFATLLNEPWKPQ